MAYTDDWESLMNGVFGAGGKLKFSTATPQPDAKAKTGGLPDLNAALLDQQKQLDELLKKQNAQLKKQDNDTQAALESYQLTAGLETLGVVDADTWESLRLAAQGLCRECQEG